MSDRRFVTIRKENHVAVVTLNRPDSLNAISGAMADELHEAFVDVAGDRDTWVMVLGAAGDKAFCVGADLKERSGFDIDDYYSNRKQISGMFKSLRAVPQPAIAAVFGYALGGGFELALSCDLIVAADGTELGLPEARVGLLPAGGGTQLLVRKVGPSKAKEAIFTGARMDAAGWFDLGVVSEVVPRERLEDSAMELARAICRSSPVAVREAKRAIEVGSGMPIEMGIQIEDDAWAVVITSEDRSEGTAAFNEKRDPRWKNR